jgi:hypothetical protein
MVFAQNTCTVNDGKNFQTYLSLHPEIKHIIFFSTWCSDCKEKLLELKKKEELSKEYLLVNSFDQKGHGEKALEYLKISLPCFYDPNNLIAKEYNIFVVPGEVQR